MGQPKTLSIFVPAHNEVRNLDGAVRDIVAAARATCDDYEILVVDDGSTDGTAEVADRLARNNPRIKVIRHATKRGIAAGYGAALARATQRYFAFLPGDREVGAASIRAIFEAVGSADLVLPYHQNRGARPWHRRVMTWFCTTLLNVLFGRHLRYYQGPAVYPTQLARDLPVTARGFFFLTERLVQALTRGCNYVEVGHIHQERAHGKSKAVTLSNILMALQTILRLWWQLRVRGTRVRHPRVAMGSQNTPLEYAIDERRGMP
jgi:glycosyltransferase involved in cell wall biosynthesis